MFLLRNIFLELSEEGLRREFGATLSGLSEWASQMEKAGIQVMTEGMDFPKVPPCRKEGDHLQRSDEGVDDDACPGGLYDGAGLGGLSDGACLWILDDPDRARELIRQGKAVLGVIAGEESKEDGPGSEAGNSHGEAFRFDGIAFLGYYLSEMEPEYLERLYRRQKGIPWEILETERCLVRETVLSDAKAFYEIYADPSITRFMEDLPKDEAEFGVWLSEYKKHVYGFLDYGIWTVCRKAKDVGTAQYMGAAQNMGAARDIDAVQKKKEAWTWEAAADKEKTGDWEAAADKEKTGDWEAADGSMAEVVIGRAGLTVREGFEDPELGFVIGKNWQGMGYAKEVCDAVLSYARDLGIRRILAFAEEENEPSKHLLQKLGFARVGELDIDGRHCLQFVAEFYDGE